MLWSVLSALATVCGMCSFIQTFLHINNNSLWKFQPQKCDHALVVMTWMMWLLCDCHCMTYNIIVCVMCVGRIYYVCNVDVVCACVCAW